nr:hypothetical protein [Amycolatopsis sp. MtRt-6]
MAAEHDGELGAVVRLQQRPDAGAAQERHPGEVGDQPRPGGEGFVERADRGGVDVAHQGEDGDPARTFGRGDGQAGRFVDRAETVVHGAPFVPALQGR